MPLGRKGEVQNGGLQSVIPFGVSDAVATRLEGLSGVWDEQDPSLVGSECVSGEAFFKNLSAMDVLGDGLPR